MFRAIRLDLSGHLDRHERQVLYLATTFYRMDGDKKIRDHHRKRIGKVKACHVDEDECMVTGPTQQEAKIINDAIKAEKLKWMKIMVKMEENQDDQTRAIFREYLDRSNQKTVDNTSFIVKFREYSEIKMSKSTMKLRNSVLISFQKYEEKYGEINWKSVDYMMFDKWIAGLLDGSLTKKGNPLTNKTIVTYISPLVSFMDEMKAVHLFKNDHYPNFKKRFTRKYKVVSKHKPSILPEELIKFNQYEVENELELQIRDVYFVMISTGDRYSDASAVKKSMVEFKDDKVYVCFNAQKTAKRKYVEVVGFAALIITKYYQNSPEDRLFHLLPNETGSYTRMLQRLGESAGLDRMISQEYTIGSKRINTEVPLYVAFTSHTGRVSHGVLFLELGGSAKDLQKNYDHADIKTTMRYANDYVPSGSDIDTLTVLEN